FGQATAQAVHPIPNSGESYPPRPEPDKNCSRDSVAEESIAWAGLNCTILQVACIAERAQGIVPRFPCLRSLTFPSIERPPSVHPRPSISFRREFAAPVRFA